MQDLINELNQKSDELTASIKLLKDHGKRLSLAERNYKVEVNQEVLRLRAEGMAVTLIQLVVYGQPKVAELRMLRDIAEVMYETNKEHINVCKLQIRILEGQIQREWGSPNDR